MRTRGARGVGRDTGTGAQRGHTYVPADRLTKVGLNSLGQFVGVLLKPERCMKKHGGYGEATVSESREHALVGGHHGGTGFTRPQHHE